MSNGFFDFLWGGPKRAAPPKDADNGSNIDPGMQRRIDNAKKSSRGYCPFVAGQKVICVGKGNWETIHNGKITTGPDYDELCRVKDIVKTEIGVSLRLYGYEDQGIFAWRHFKPLEEAKAEEKKEAKAPAPKAKSPFDDLLTNPLRPIPDDGKDKKVEKTPQKV